MNSTNDVIYIGIDNWFYGRDYPAIKKLADWVNKNQFNNDEWCKEQKICVVSGVVDMSTAWLITAPRSWVESNLPELLTDDSYEYQLKSVSKDGEQIHTYTKKYSDFICKPDPKSDDELPDYFDYHFKEYCEDNFGCDFQDNYWVDADEEDDDENEEDEAK